MAKVSDVYAGDYVAAAELQNKGRISALIVEADVEAVGQDQTQKVVLVLKNPDGRTWPRRLVLNKTNGLILASAYGDDTNAWPGQAVEVWAEPVQFQGRMVQGIKLAPMIAPSAGNVTGHQATHAVAAFPAVARARSAQATSSVDEDDIPF